MVEVFFNSPAGRIEGVCHQSKNVNAPLALVLHPHPQYGGSMHNKIVCNIYDAFANNDFSVLKINFRGTGKSTGAFDKGIGELSDAATAMDWLQENNSSTAPFWVAGFSFGAWVAMQLMMRRPEIESFIAIAPPTNKYDFSFLAPCPVPGLIVQGNQDNIVEETSVSQLANKLINSMKNEYMKYHVVDGADHFFRNDPGEVSDVVSAYIKAWPNSASAINKNNLIKRARRRTRQYA